MVHHIVECQAVIEKNGEEILQLKMCCKLEKVRCWKYIRKM